MSPTRTFSLSIFACGFAAAIGILFAGSFASAGTLNWDNGVSVGGSGNFQWDASSGTANWSGSAWSDGSDAVFGSTGVGTINVVGNVSPNSLTFNADGYTLAAARSPSPRAMSASPAAATATIGSTMTLNADMTLSGGGTLKVVAGGWIGNTNGTAAVNVSSSILNVAGGGN